MCHRLKCGYKGVRGNVEDTLVPKHVVDHPTPPPRVPVLRPMPPDVTAHLRLLVEDINQVRYSTNGVVFPLYNHNGVQWGWLERSYPWAPNANPHKANLLATSKGNLHFPRKSQFTGAKSDTPTIMLVEDVPSSIKASHFIPCAALLGTNISLDMLGVLADKYKRVIIALDADALGKSAKYVSSMAEMFHIVQFVPLTKDIKDMPLHEVANLIRGILHGH